MIRLDVRRVLWAVVFLAVRLPEVGSAAGHSEPVDIGSRLELFVDHHLIDRLDGVRLQLHSPRPAGVALRYDESWEGRNAFIPAMVKGPEKYHMYYRGFADYQRGDPFVVEHQCYAVSEDGIHWTKPNLRRIEIEWPARFRLEKTRNNNALFKDQAFIPFLDTRPGVPPSQRFKGLRSPPRLDVDVGVRAYASGDGLNWKLMREERVYAGDRLTQPFWSESEQLYIQYARIDDKRSGNLIRTIGRSTSPDFLDWSGFEHLDYGSHPPTEEEQFYECGASAYFRAPHIYLLLVARFLPDRQALTDAEAKSAKLREKIWRDCSETILMTSRGGKNVDRTFREGFIRPGLGPRNWTTRTNYPGMGIVPTGPAEISIYLNRHFGQKSNHIERLTLRTDGFVSVSAPYSGGELLTRPLKFEGSELTINYSTAAAGSLRVEIQDAAGKPISGFALADCPEIIGDHIERVVSWQGGRNVSKLAGQPVRLRLVMKDADLYSIRFR